MADNDVENVPEETIGEKSSLYPVKVTYCPECSMPPEYCSFSDKYAKCKPWLMKNFPHLLSGEAKVEEVTQAVEKLNVAEDKPPVPAEEPKKLPGGKVKKQPAAEIIISSEQRQKRKTVTHVSGLTKFGIKLPDAAKLFAKKFACSASATKDKDSILIQGDVKDDLVDFILGTWHDKVKEEQIFFADENGSNKTPARD